MKKQQPFDIEFTRQVTKTETSTIAFTDEEYRILDALELEHASLMYDHRVAITHNSARFHRDQAHGVVRAAMALIGQRDGFNRDEHEKMIRAAFEQIGSNR